jgi:hypothetical protein
VLQDGHRRGLEFHKVLQLSKGSRLYTSPTHSATSAYHDTLCVGDSGDQVRTQAVIAGFERRQRRIQFMTILNLQNYTVVYMLFVLLDSILRIFGIHFPDMQFRMMTDTVTNRKGARLVSDVSMKTEYLGLVPGLCEVGDYVVLVQGVRTPLVLRPKGQACVPKEDAEGQVKIVQAHTWEFIGDCYVHGVMDGDVWETRRHECEELWIA